MTDPVDTSDPVAWARVLGVSVEAVQLYLASDVIDLHVDSFIWTRVLGYELQTRHGQGPLAARYFSQVDFPRIREAHVSGALWSITTNPLRTAAGRAHAFKRNLEGLREICGAEGDRIAMVHDLSSYRAARERGAHAVFVSIQGGNALDAGPDALSVLADGSVLAVTLLHLSNSTLGGTSSPLGRASRGLSPRGRAYVERLNELRVFVDLAHISPRGFDDAVEAHDSSQPLLVTHTGVSGVHPSWRNLNDAQLRAVAATGGVVGVIFHGGFLGAGYWHGGSCIRIVDHLAHIVTVVGEDHAALGSDWDGAIITPRDLPTCLELPRLVQRMLDRGFSEALVRKILGGNFLRALGQLRG
jgi:membrane dipeptidase